MDMKMEVYALPDLELLDTLEEFRSLLYEEKAYAAGTFTLEAILNDRTRALLKPDRLIWFAGDSAGIIESMESRSGGDGPYITVRGRMLSGLLDRRILWGQYDLTGAPEQIMRRLVDDCAIHPTRGSTAARVLPHLILEDGGDDARLPAGYTELSYIESSGTQYVDTGFTPNENTRVTADFQAVSFSGTFNAVFGERNSSGANGIMLYAQNSTNQYCALYGAQYLAIPNVTLETTNRHSCDFNKNSISLDGETVAAGVQAFTGASTITLFCMNQDNLKALYGNFRLFSCAVYDNNVKVRDFVPCTDTSGEAGLYDLVGGTFYGNAGTGAFSSGPVVSTQARASSMTIRKQKTGGSLLEALSEIGEAYGVAFGVRFDPEQLRLVFWARPGENLAAGQETPVFYSTELDDVLSATYTCDTSDSRNVALVAGEGDGTARIYTVVGDGAASDTARFIPSGSTEALQTSDGKSMRARAASATSGDTYISQYTGPQIDEAVGKALSGGGGGSDGVSSFNGRTGAVTPQEGDYTAGMVGAIPVSGGDASGPITFPSARNDVPIEEQIALRSSGSSENMCVRVQKSSASGRALIRFYNGADTPANRCRISGVAQPISNGDAAPKDYVDAAIQAAVLDSWEASY